MDESSVKRACAPQHASADKSPNVAETQIIADVADYNPRGGLNEDLAALRGSIYGPCWRGLRTPSLIPNQLQN